MRGKFCRAGILWIILVAGCNNEPSVLRIGTSTFEQDYGVVLVDTVTVGVSTVLLDSIPTSNTGVLLVGGNSDVALGLLSSEGYLQVGLNAAWEPSEKARFDSLVLIAKYSGYVYGDTTKPQTYSVNRITGDFKTYTIPQFWIDEGQYSALYKDYSLYNTSTVRSTDTPLGSKTVRARPHSKDSLVVRLDDQLGEEWLHLAQTKAASFTTLSSFIEYFKGIAISNTSDQQHCVLGFATDSVKLRLYYSEYSNDVLKQKSQEFPFSSGLFNYSKIASNRSGSVLENLTRDNKQLPAAVTNGESFVQSGTGIVTKLSFPSVRKLIDLKTLLIVNQAQLIIEPVKDTYSDDYPLPGKLTLYLTDKSNLPIRQLNADYSTDTGQSASITFDEEFDTNSGYVFSITQYVQNLLSTEGNLDQGLLVVPVASELDKTVNGAVLKAGTGGVAARIKLKIWITTKQ